MGRKKREWYPGAVLHVMARGIRKQAIFMDEEDYIVFMRLMDIAKTKMDFDVCCYCLMTNHFHVLIKTKETEVGRALGYFMSSYARYFNKKYGFVGHLFDSRYVSKLVNDERYLLEVSRYIHLNPVKAGIVKSPLDYPYSSYGVYTGACMDENINTDIIQELYQDGFVEKYRYFVESKEEHKDMEDAIQKDMGEDEQWLPSL